MTTLAFIDTETTGLDPVRHEIWEVGMILRGDDWRREYVWQLPVDLGRADVIAMNIGGIRQRRTSAWIRNSSIGDSSSAIRHRSRRSSGSEHRSSWRPRSGMSTGSLLACTAANPSRRQTP